VDESVLSVLREMGMSDYEAKTLYALLRLREATAKQIAEYGDIPRTKVYETLERFVQMGYVTEIDARPRRYVIEDPQRVLSALVNEQKKKVERLEAKVKKLGRILPALSEKKEIRGNYILRFKSPEHLLNIVGDEIKPKSVVGISPKSVDLLKNVGGKHVDAPFDFLLTDKAIYIPLAPLGEPSRETTVVVFQDPHIVNIFRRWLNERGDL
jgi:DNA-binding MarR family transcriptional regulator